MVVALGGRRWVICRDPMGVAMITSIDKVAMAATQPIKVWYRDPLFYIHGVTGLVQTPSSAVATAEYVRMRQIAMAIGEGETAR
jgi:hypothetical protein